MTKVHKQATFQPTIRPSWAGAMSYIPVEEKAKILDALVKYPEVVEIDSIFWKETIKPDLDLQYNKFITTCEARKQVARTYWDNQKETNGIQLHTKCISKDIQMITNTKDKDKDKDNIKVKDKIKYNHYGELNNVCLTEDDYNKLLSTYPDFKEAIEVLDTWLGTSGSKNKNKNHYAYFKSNSWVWDRIKPKQIERKKTQAQLIEEHNLKHIEELFGGF